MRTLALVCVPLLLSACSNTRNSAPPAQPAGFQEVFPHVRVDAIARVVEFDAQVSPILVYDARTPLVYLETLVCTFGTREHETLLASHALPSHIHAALLVSGAQSGSPGGFSRATDGKLFAHPPSGDALDVRFILPDERAVDPLQWVVNARDQQPLRESAIGDHAGFVFAGSRFVQRQGIDRYAGDLGGNIVGLATFGDEVVAFSHVLSPEAAVHPPEWIARLDHIPPAGTPVRVRLTTSPASSPPDTRCTTRSQDGP